MPADPPLLPDLDPADHEALTAICRRRTFRRGETLDPAAGQGAVVLLVRRGVMRLTAGLNGTAGVLAGLAGPGSVIGLERALNRDGEGPGAVALTEVVGFAVEAGLLRRMAAERPGLALALAVAAAEQLDEARAELGRQAHQRIEQRLARLLLGLWDRIEEPGLLITQDDLAEMLAVQRTTVTLLASRLRAAGLIAYSRGRVRILDPEGLSRMAQDGPAG